MNKSSCTIETAYEAQCQINYGKVELLNLCLLFSKGVWHLRARNTKEWYGIVFFLNEMKSNNLCNFKKRELKITLPGHLALDWKDGR